MSRFGGPHKNGGFPVGVRLKFTEKQMGYPKAGTRHLWLRDGAGWPIGLQCFEKGSKTKGKWQKADDARKLQTTPDILRADLGELMRNGAAVSCSLHAAILSIQDVLEPRLRLPGGRIMTNPCFPPGLFGWCACPSPLQASGVINQPWPSLAFGAAVDLGVWP